MKVKIQYYKEPDLKKLLKVTALFTIFIFAAVITAFSKRATELCSHGLRICAFSVVPSLFPYMVISKLLVSSGIFTLPQRLFYPMRLYNLPPSSGAAVLMGALCGFPVGAATAVEMYKNGELSKTQTEVLISACNNTGPSFIISVIGASFFRNASFGQWLYASQLIASAASAIFINRLLFPFKWEERIQKKRRIVMPDIFTAVQSSVSSTLTVCGFIVFFYVISGFMTPFLTRISPDLAAVFAALLEFSSGSKYAAMLTGPKGRFFSGLAVGFSGLSVFCQTASFTSKEGLSLKRCFCTKLLQGILTGALAALPMPFIGSVGPSAISQQTGYIPISPLPVAIISSILYIFAANTLIKTKK